MVTRKDNRKPLTTEYRDKVAALWIEGKTQEAIARELGYGVGSVASVIRRQLISGRLEPRNPIKPVDPEILNRIKILWNEGHFKISIARLVHVTGDVLTGIIRRAIDAGEIAPRAKIRDGKWIFPDEDGEGDAPKVTVEAPPPEPMICKGESGVDVFRYPSGLKGKPLFGGVGALPEGRPNWLCQMVLNENDKQPGAWRHIVFCDHRALRGCAYCPEHQTGLSIRVAMQRSPEPK